MTSAYLFIGADPTINAGEADYFHALALAARSLPDDALLCRTVGWRKDRHNRNPCRCAPQLRGSACGTARPYSRHHNRSSHHRLRFQHDRLLHRKSPRVLAATHKCITSPLCCQKIARRFWRRPTQQFTHRLAAHHLASTSSPCHVPHTNTHAAAQGALDIFTTRNHAQEFMQHVDAGDDFVCAVVNAGFADANGVHQPYTRDEAAGMAMHWAVIRRLVRMCC